MGNDAYKPVRPSQLYQNIQRLLQGLFIQGTESFVNEHGIQPDATGA